MSSVVYYKFRSGKDLKRLGFDGTGISVYDLKKQILLAEKLDQTADTFALNLESPDTHEIYDDDSTVIPRSSSVIALRTPVNRLGAFYSASRYVSGTAIQSKNAQRKEDFDGKQDLEQDFAPSLTNATSESDVMSAVFAAQGAQWMQTQQEMATKTPIYYNKQTQAKKEADKTVPSNYICNRCGQKGHWINDCPSLYDPNWETKKIRRTTGIPKAMLKTIEKPEGEEDGKTYLMNAKGEYVVAMADEKSWEDFQAKQLQQQAKQNREVPLELQDPITHELMKNPQKMPCCSAVYSNASVEDALIQSDFCCPNCGAQNVYIDQLTPDLGIAQKIKEFTKEPAEADKLNGEEEEDDDDQSMDIDSDSSYSPDPFNDDMDIEIRNTQPELENSSDNFKENEYGEDFGVKLANENEEIDEYKRELEMVIQGRIR